MTLACSFYSKGGINRRKEANSFFSVLEGVLNKGRWLNRGNTVLFSFIIFLPVIILLPVKIEPFYRTINQINLI